MPAFNLNLSSVLFASAAKAASADASLSDALTFRIDAGDKIGSTAKYSPYAVCVTKGNDSGKLFLYVQGKDAEGDWVQSFVVPAEGVAVLANDIREGADLSKCKIWLETTNEGDNLAYAKMVTDEDTTKYDISTNVYDEKLGSATASVEESSVTSALFGEPVTLTATPNAGYVFVKWESEDVTVDEEGVFIMPNKDVSIEAVFEPHTPHDFGEDGRTETCSVCNIKNINAPSLDEKIVIEDLPYTGLGLSPVVTIEGLTKNTDYEISYDEPKTNLGEYDVTIKGIGQYAGIRNAKWKISQGTPVCEAPKGLSATFGQKLRDVSLDELNPDGNTEGAWSWNKEIQSVGNVGVNTFKATFTPDDLITYKVMDDIDVAVTVEKADYEDDKPYTEFYFWNKQYDEKQIDLTQFVPKNAGETSFAITSQNVFPEGATDTITSAKIAKWWKELLSLL